MVKKIDKKIVAYKVRTKDEPQEDLSVLDDVVHMHETVLRPERLMGTTYKLKTPEHVSEHSLFITINDIILNEGTVHETRRPFEIFINSKSLEHYQWIVALTRIISAVFRKGGDVTFLVEELRSVFDPKGGYWNKGKYVPSLIAEIGNVIESHLTEIGMLKAPGLDEHQQAFLAEKQAELKAAQEAEEQQAGSGFPANAALCYKCHTKALVLKDGCMTCLNCGDSKCG
ncbi:TSCPD domain-containing protein [Aeromonas sp. 82P]|uniref:TSCPD domain-containing protein n=1 Tax=Aeromonas TaxID=642 RepID=UPI0023633135|nr:NrdJb [Aeromonas veronii]MDD1842992.1 NrdJb [Aeromonas veronii]